MSWALIGGLGMVTVTIIVGFATLWRALGRIELRIELMWDWYLKSHADILPGGRRKYDPPMTDR